jgi:hypothetical protein
MRDGVRLPYIAGGQESESVRRQAGADVVDREWPASWPLCLTYTLTYTRPSIVNTSGETLYPASTSAAR